MARHFLYEKPGAAGSKFLLLLLFKFSKMLKKRKSLHPRSWGYGVRFKPLDKSTFLMNYSLKLSLNTNLKAHMCYLVQMF